MSDLFLSKQYFEEVIKPSSNYYKKYIKPRKLSPEEEYKTWFKSMTTETNPCNSKELKIHND